MRRPTNQPRDLRFEDERAASRAREATSAVHRILGEEAPFEPQYGSVPGIEA